MKEKILDFLKGILIGISNVIPGFSGGTMAVILKVYDKLINAFAHFFKMPWKIIKDVWALALGAMVGVMIAVIGVAKLLENFPIPTVLFFVGLIIGSIPSIFKSATKEKLKKRDIIAAIVCAAIIVITPFLPTATIKNTDVDFIAIVMIIIMGALSAGAMIIPGISGSLVLMAFGYYTYFMGHLDFFVDILKTGSFAGSLGSILIVLGFIFGAIIGLVFVSKLIESLLKKAPQTVYYGILGLLIASPFAIVYTVLKVEDAYQQAVANSTYVSWIIGFVLMAVSAFIAGYMSLLDEKNESKKQRGEEIAK